MTTIQPTICGYSIETLIALLLGDVTKQTKAAIVEDARESRELTAFMSYLQRLLEANDYDAERVTTIAEQQMTALVEELEKFNEELEADVIASKQSIYATEDVPFFIKETVTNRNFAKETPVFYFTIAAHTNRLPPTDPLSIVGLNDTKSPLHRLTQAISDELAQNPLGEKELEHFLTACYGQLKDRRTPNNRFDFQKKLFSPWSYVKSIFTAS
jgi:hypothetical protein